MLVPMKTSWTHHRPHAAANLGFRVMSAVGFLAGLAVSLTRGLPPTPDCDIAQASCVTTLLRFEAVHHVAPPVAGLLAGMLVGAWLARGLHAHYARART
jgi:hypothetical protein